jgi:plastocyanin
MHSDSTSGGDGGVTRRAFVRSAAGAAAAGGAGVVATNEAAAQAETYRFGGEVAAWNGRAPATIEGTTNPTIELEAGTEYEFWFENVDGQPHNMTIQDEAGSTIVQSELITNEGATASVTFTATSAMTTYICTIHPTTMIGDLEVTGQAEGEAGGGGVSLRVLLLASAVLLAFVSPLLFALFLFSRRGGGGDETPAG